jgi:2'-5' RNA ligase
MANDPPRKRRLFIGIALDDAARAGCAAVADELRKTGFAARYEAPAKLHATLAFLGFVEPARVDDVVAKLAACAGRAAPLDVTLDKLGAFPHERRPRVVFVGAREQGALFRALAGIVRDAYNAAGFEFHNDAIAHVTIARVKESVRPLPLVEFAPISLSVRSLTLFESLPDPATRTSRYEIAARVDLSGAGKV